MEIFERLESEVRGYCRSFPAVFTKARGHALFDENGNEYIDFFAGAGVLNYGHNPPRLKARLIEYLREDGVTHSLDMMTTAKETFLRRFEEVVLRPRGMDYKIQFPGPTGTNAVEAALKLARKVTGRTEVVSFTNGFHGMTLGSLAVTGNAGKRGGAGIPLPHATSMPYDGYLGPDIDTVDVIASLIEDGSSGLDLPAAFIVETVQAEGGVNVASRSWMRRLEQLARRHGILLIVDDIQVGCGRTGPFFSFEGMGIEPDILCLSKSLSGYGVPFALTLFKPDLDVWSPGEHNGTFRGHNLAFVTAAEALSYWEDDAFSKDVLRKAAMVEDALDAMIDGALDAPAARRGRGLIQGIAFEDAGIAPAISKEAFGRGLIIETAGADDEVLKLLPPLTIPDAALMRGLEIIESSARRVLANGKGTAVEDSIGADA